MRFLRPVAVFAVLVTALMVAMAEPHRTPETTRALAERIVRAAKEDRLERVKPQIGPGLWDAIQQSKAGVQAELKRLGDLKSLTVSSWQIGPQGEATATLLAAFENGRLNLDIVVDAEGIVQGLLYRPANTQEDRSRYRMKTPMRLPFEGEWYAFHGGPDPAKNHHANVPAQRFAYDFVIRDANGKTHRGAGRRNEDYYAFGKPVLAPADGAVVVVVDGVPDNPPGQTDSYFIPGNTVVIRHGNNEWSFLAHFKQGSIRVKPGQTVKAGDLLGLCGNSGNSTEPHIHFHVQDNENVNLGLGLPVTLRSFLQNGERKESAVPDGRVVLKPIN